MNCWQILKIEPTYDKKIIKKAYLTLLKSCHPEEKPAEFMALREAYDEALKQSVKVDFTPKDIVEEGVVPELSASDEPTKDNSISIPLEKEINHLDQFAKAVETLYYDIPKRWSVDEWKAIFNSPFVYHPDTHREAGNFCIRFFLSHRYVSNEVFEAFITTFDFEQSFTQWTQRGMVSDAKELSFLLQDRCMRIGMNWLKTYQGSFEKLQQHLAFRENLEIRFLNEGLRGYELCSILANVDPDFFNDVDLNCFAAQLLISDSAYYLANQIYASVDEEDLSQAHKKNYADLLQKLNDHPKAIKLYQSILSDDPQNPAAQKGLAKSLMATGHIETAIAIFEDLLEERFYDYEMRSDLFNAYNLLLDTLEDNADNAFKRADTLFNLGCYQECIDFVANYQDQFDDIYSILKARSLQELGEAGKAEKEYLRVIAKAYRNGNILPEAVQKVIMAYSYKYSLEDFLNYIVPSIYALSSPQNTDPQYILSAGLARYHIWDLMLKENAEEALVNLQMSDELMELARQKMPFDGNAAWYQGRVKFYLGEYKQAIECFEVTANEFKVWAPVHNLMAQAYKHLDQLHEASVHYEKCAERYDDLKLKSEYYLKSAQIAKDNMQPKRALMLLEQALENQEGMDIERLGLASEIYYLADVADEKEPLKQKTLDLQIQYIEACKAQGPACYTSSNQSVIEAYSRIMHLLTDMGKTELLTQYTEQLGQLFTESL